jgi:hypothetical protein
MTLIGRSANSRSNEINHASPVEFLAPAESAESDFIMTLRPSAPDVFYHSWIVFDQRNVGDSVTQDRIVNIVMNIGRLSRGSEFSVVQSIETGGDLMLNISFLSEDELRMFLSRFSTERRNSSELCSLACNMNYVSGSRMPSLSSGRILMSNIIDGADNDGSKSDDAISEVTVEEICKQ